MRVFRAFAAGCLVLLGANQAIAEDTPRIVTVNYALQYFAERLAGEDAVVDFPVPQEVDPSFWRPSIADISAIQSADLVLLNGAGFAKWVDRVSLPRSKLVNTTAAIEDRFIFTESITHSHGDGGEHSHEGLASYVWLDPTLAIAQSEAIAAALIRRNLVPEEDVTARLADLRKDLEALDADAQATLSKFQNVAIVATHPRYQYLARRYGLSVSSVNWEAGAAPDDAQIDALRTLVSQTKASVLIWEAQPPEAAFEATEALGLSNIVFSPLARADEGRSFLQTYATALAALADQNAD